MLRKSLAGGVLAGAMVSIGGCVFLACENRYVGAALFTVALLVICYFGFSLYTGAVGFLVRSHSGPDLTGAFSGLLGNLIGTVLLGLLVAYALPALHDAALIACERRLEQAALQTLIRGFLCGILMYAAVWIFRKKQSPLGVIFCIPVFILSGFEHSVADMFYFAAAGMFTGRAALFVLLVVLGNSLGGMLIPTVQLLGGVKEDG